MPELAYSGKGARQVRPPDADSGHWVARWDPVWIRIGERWQVGVLRGWIRRSGDPRWLAQVEYASRATAGWSRDFFLYDPQHIRPLQAQPPSD